MATKYRIKFKKLARLHDEMHDEVTLGRETNGIRFNKICELHAAIGEVLEQAEKYDPEQDDQPEAQDDVQPTITKNLPRVGGASDEVFRRSMGLEDFAKADFPSASRYLRK